MPNNDDPTFQIDTGTGGFEIPEVSEGTSYTYDVGDPNRDPGVTFPTNKGNLSIDETPKDISKSTRKVLADYLGKKTTINYYPLDGDVDAVSSTVNVVGENNKTPPVGNISNSQHFPEPNVQDGVKPTYDGSLSTSPGLKSWMNSPGPDAKTYNPPNSMMVGLLKGKSNPLQNESVDGNKLLPQVKKDNLGTIESYTSQVLSNNRFTGLGDRFASFMSAGGNENERNGFNPRIYSPKYSGLTHGKLAQVGIALSTRASLELGTDEQNFNPSSQGTELKAIIPSFGQLGLKTVNIDSLRATDVLNNLDPNAEIPADNYTNISNRSWGSINNVYDRYDGIAAAGMLTLATALTAAMILLFETISLLFYFDGSSKRTGSSGRYFSGKSSVGKVGKGPLGIGAFPLTLFGIEFTYNPFGKAVRAGIHAYFGIDDSGIVSALISAVTKTSKNNYMSPGYVVAISRAVMRSLYVIFEAVKNIMKSANVISAIQNAFSLIDTIRRSKLISTLQIFASLGDQVLNDKGADDLDKGWDSEPVRKSKIDKLEDNAPGATTSKGRLQGGNVLKLAWASNRAHSMYMIPSSVAALQPAMRDLGSFQNGYQTDEGAGKKLSKNRFKITDENRLPYDGDEKSVQYTESLIESSDLVPFYFHDLRTNEIISFHAFIESMNDGLTANYDNIEGFGRIEPGKIYKGTTRKIDIGFTIVATSRQDYDEMWIKINKLTTLLYPQYTEGRWLTNENGGGFKFTQPFSQMIGASPLIRLRLGNLVASNYSRFALARLFGATLKGSKYGPNGSFDFKNVEESYGEIKTKIEKALENSTDYFWTINGAGSVSENDSGSLIGGMTLGGGNGYAKQWDLDKNKTYLPYVKIKVDVPLGNDNPHVIVTPQIPDSDFLTNEGISDTILQNRIIQGIKDTFDDPEKNPMSRIINGSYAIPKEKLKLSKISEKKIYAELAGKNANATLQDLSEFMDTEKNALVKSFKSTAGKGLAGVIDSLSFDWGGANINWELDSDARAPKMCKVSLGFTPIHDITPGLDSQGYNRAPIYPVGPYAHGKDSLKPKGT